MREVDRLLHGRPDSIFISKARSGQNYSARPAAWPKRTGIEAARSALPGRSIEALGEGEEPRASDDPTGAGMVERNPTGEDMIKAIETKYNNHRFSRSH